MNEVYWDFRFSISQVPVEISHMNRGILHDLVNVVLCHRDDYLLSWRTFSCHLDAWLGFWRSFNDIVDLIDFLDTNWRKCFFNFDYISRTHILFGSLDVGLGFVSWQVDCFVILKEFQNFVNLLRRFCWDWREKPVNVSWGWTILFLVIPLRRRRPSWEWILMQFSFLMIWNCCQCTTHLS